ncbi:transcriptional regulator TbsP [Halomicrococcus sp. NG-SE-24]|uniref:transcriptional regulator TbsP n=1 Tax=Halomicrococcus sp. NG-SE-24 TaxID=3436928 RepID=UPI003D96EEBC
MSTEAVNPDTDFDETLASLFGDAETVLVVNPSLAVFRTAMETAFEFDDELPTLQVLATPDVLRTGTEDFILASQVADLINQETLSLRTTTSIARSSLFVSNDQVMTVVPVDGGLSGLTSTDEEFVETVRSAFDDDWDEGEEFSLRTPPLSRVQDTLSEEFDEEVEDDFMTMLESMETVPGEEDELDEVTIALLVAADNELLLYDLSKWGEDVGLASKATFSRTKTRLEDRGLLDTEKVPIEVGRPRLRLLLEPDDLEDVDAIAEQATAA